MHVSWPAWQKKLRLRKRSTRSRVVCTCLSMCVHTPEMIQAHAVATDKRGEQNNTRTWSLAYVGGDVFRLRAHLLDGVRAKLFHDKRATLQRFNLISSITSELRFNNLICCILEGVIYSSYGKGFYKTWIADYWIGTFDHFLCRQFPDKVFRKWLSRNHYKTFGKTKVQFATPSVDCMRIVQAWRLAICESYWQQRGRLASFYLFEIVLLKIVKAPWKVTVLVTWVHTTCSDMFSQPTQISTTPAL